MQKGTTGSTGHDHYAEIERLREDPARGRATALRILGAEFPLYGQIAAWFLRSEDPDAPPGKIGFDDGVMDELWDTDRDLYFLVLVAHCGRDQIGPGLRAFVPAPELSEEEMLALGAEDFLRYMVARVARNVSVLDGITDSLPAAGQPDGDLQAARLARLDREVRVSRQEAAAYQAQLSHDLMRVIARGETDPTPEQGTSREDRS